MWDRLPLIIAGLGHHDARVVRDIASKCIALATSQKDGLSHPLAKLLLDAESSTSLLPQMQLLATGADIETLPALHCIATRMAFIPVVERSIEGRHKCSKTELLMARRIGVPALSFRLRQKEVGNLLLQGSMQMRDLSQYSTAIAKDKTGDTIKEMLAWRTRPADQQMLTTRGSPTCNLPQ